MSSYQMVRASYGVQPTPYPATDNYYNSVTLLMHGQGAHGGTVFTDNSSDPLTATVPAGVVTTSTTEFLFGTSSLSFTSGSRLQIAHRSDMIFSGDLVVEVAFNLPATTGAGRILVAKMTTTGHRPFMLSINSSGQLQGSWSNTSPSATVLVGTTILAPNTWYRATLVKRGNSLFLLLGGNLEATAATSGSGYFNASDPIVIGNDTSGANPIASGATPAYIAELRITQNWDRKLVWPHVPPTAMFPDSSAFTPRVQMEFDAGSGSTTFTDTAGSTWTRASTETCTTSTILQGVSSLDIVSGGASRLEAPWTAGNSVPASNDFFFRFMMRASSWLAPAATGCHIVGIQDLGGTAAQSVIGFGTNASQQLYLMTSNGTTRTVTVGSGLPTNLNMLIEVRREGNTITVKSNGIVHITVTFTGNFPVAGITTPWRIGSNVSNTASCTNGMIFDRFLVEA